MNKGYSTRKCPTTRESASRISTASATQRTSRTRAANEVSSFTLKSRSFELNCSRTSHHYCLCCCTVVLPTHWEWLVCCGFSIKTKVIVTLPTSSFSSGTTLVTPTCVFVIYLCTKTARANTAIRRHVRPRKTFTAGDITVSCQGDAGRAHPHS